MPIEEFLQASLDRETPRLLRSMRRAKKFTELIAFHVLLPRVMGGHQYTKRTGQESAGGRASTVRRVALVFRFLHMCRACATAELLVCLVGFTNVVGSGEYSEGIRRGGGSAVVEGEDERHPVSMLEDDNTG